MKLVRGLHFARNDPAVRLLLTSGAIAGPFSRGISTLLQAASSAAWIMLGVIGT